MRSDIETVFLLAGQSNMDGRGAGAGLPAELAAVPANVTWLRIDPQSSLPVANDGMLGTAGKAKGRFGPHAAFIHELARARPDAACTVIVSALGGTAMAAWSGEDGEGGPLYQGMMRGVAAVLAGRAVRFAAFLWLQGESDAGSTADRYLAGLTALVRLVRRDTRTPHLPVLCAEPAVGEPVYAALARAAQRDPLLRVVACRELAHQDPEHYDAGAAVEIGRRFWAAYARIAASRQG